ARWGENRRSGGLVHPPLARLRAVVEDGAPALQANMLPAERRKPVAVVLLRVGLATDPEEPEVEHADPAGEHPLAHEAAPRQVVDHCGTDCGEAPGEREHPVALELVL